MGNLTKNTITRGAVVALALSAGAATTANAAVTRTAGATRYSTATEIFKAWPTTTTTAVLAAGVGHDVDALTVAPLAKKNNAPVILVDTKDTTANIVAQFTAFTKVYIANGTGVVSADVEAALKAAGKTVVRLGGATRTETALNIAKEIGAANGIVVANGDDSHLVDTLSIASIAAAKGMPIFITQGGSLSAAEAIYAKGLVATNVYALGGTTVVSDAAVAGLAPTVTRLAGAGRYETNAAVVTKFKADLDLSNIYVASGEDANLIDALAGAPLAGLKNAPIVFAHNNVNADVNTLLNDVVTGSTNIVILGGTGAVTSAVETSLTSIQAASTPATLVVGSVNAINRDQILVVFNQKVDKTTAETIANYALNGTSLSTASISTDATASLQDDGKSVMITAGSSGGFVWNSTPASCTLQTNTGYILTVDGVKSTDLTKSTSSYKTGSFAYSDSVAPSVVSVKSSAITSTRTVTVKFSEPVTGVGLYTINGTTASYTPSSLPTDTITLTAASDLVANTQYSFQVINEKDSSGNLIAINPYASNFTVAADTAAPTVVSASPVGDKVIRVTFSKAMNATYLTGTSNIKLLNSNGTDINGNGATVTIAATSGDTTGTKFDITLAGANALFNSTTKALALSMVVTSAVKDSIGNAITAVTQPVTLVLDQTKPTISSVQYVKAGAVYDGVTRTTGALVITFNKAITAVTSLSTTQYKAITDGGIDETATVGALTGSFKSNSDSKVLILTPATAFAGVNTETIRLNGSIFTDTTLGANTNDAVVQNVDLKNGLATTDSTSPAFGTIGVASNNITVAMTDASSGLDTATVLNVANYHLNGAPMPTGTYVTVSGTTASLVATLVLPSGSVATSTNYALTVTGIKDVAGNVSGTGVGNVALLDNTAPVMTGLAFNAGGTMTIAFGENVSAAVDADFVVKVGSATLVATTDYTVTAGVGADAGKVVVTFATGKAPVAGDVVSVTTKATTLTAKDANNNTAKTGVTVSATK